MNTGASTETADHLKTQQSLVLENAASLPRIGTGINLTEPEKFHGTTSQSATMITGPNSQTEVQGDLDDGEGDICLQEEISGHKICESGKKACQDSKGKYPESDCKHDKDLEATGMNSEITAQRCEVAETVEGLLDAYNNTHDIDCLNTAVDVIREFLSTLDHDDEKMKQLLDYFIVARDDAEAKAALNSLVIAYQETYDLDYINSAIEIAEERCKFGDRLKAPLDHLLEIRAMQYNKVEAQRRSFTGHAAAFEIKDLLDTFGRTGDRNVLETAIKLAEESHHRGEIGDGLVRALKNLYDPGASISIEELESAVASDGNPPNEEAAAVANMIMLLRPLQESLQAYHLTSDMEILDAGIKIAQELVDKSPNETLRRLSQRELSQMLWHRFYRTAEAEDIANAVKGVMEELAAVSETHPDRPDMLIKLGDLLDASFERTGNLIDIELAIENTTEAIQRTPDGNPKRLERLHKLISHLMVKHNRTADLDDLTKAIDICNEALSIAEAYPDALPEMWMHVSHTRYARYRALGDVEDLNQAIMWCRKAANVTNSQHPARSWILHNLALYLWKRFLSFGALEDIELSVAIQREVLGLSCTDGQAGSRLMALASKLATLFARLSNRCHLDEVITMAEEAIRKTPLDHPNQSMIKFNLAAMYGMRYCYYNNPDDLSQAINVCTEAIDTTPTDNREKARMISTLGRYYMFKGTLMNNSEDFTKAIELGEQALGMMSPNAHSREMILVNLQHSLRERYHQTCHWSDFHYLLRVCSELSICNTYTSKFRVDATYEAGMVFASKKMWQDAASMLARGIRMLPRLSSISLRRQDQEFQLSSANRLTSNAVSISVQAGEEASHCVRLLELGRGIIHGLVIDCRRDIYQLESANPYLYAKFNRLRREIDSPGISLRQGSMIGDIGESSYEQERDRIERAANELEDTLTAIRESPGFEGFLLAPRSEEVIAMASEGPIVYVNSSQLRSDAFIVTKSGIKALRLRNLLFSEVETNMNEIRKIVKGKRASYPRRNEKMEEILLWLWNAAVESILKEVEQDLVEVEGQLPRIWWIGIGLLSRAPFHAAGDHTPGSSRNTISRVISSYIPTIKALSYARQRTLDLLVRPDSTLVLVSVPTDPSQQHLPDATQEVEDIMKVVQGKTNTTHLQDPSTEDVLESLRTSHAIHFACHGLSNPLSPSESHLLLRKGDGSADKLTVAKVTAERAQNASVAFLSACSTAENSSKSLLDESLFIANGFQLAGFSHVLATQWVANDAACRDVSRSFYELLFNDAPGKMQGIDSHRKVSTSFHSAVKILRDRNLRQPIKWACYIHTGA